MQRYPQKYNKWKRRIGIVFSNSARSIVPIGLNSLISLFVIKYSSFSLWGELVSYLIIINLSTQVISWGSKQYLLRQFAVDPSNTGNNWLENLKSRSLLLILAVLIILLLNFSTSIKVILIAWQLIIYLSRSFEVLVIYHKRMKFFLLVEVVLSVIFLSAVIFFRFYITVISILTVFFLIESMRLIVSIFYFRKLLNFTFSFSINYKILSAGFIFFILGAIGMLQSRLDLYFVALFLSKNDLAVYQILINYILLIQAATGFIIQPFLKEIYRMNRQTLARFSFNFTIVGFIASIPITFILTFVIEKIYGIVMSWQMSLLTFLYIVPIFYYTIRVYLLYRIKKETLILISGISVLALSVPINYYMISMFEINGALIAGVIGELLSLCFYYYFEKRVGLAGSVKNIINQMEFIQN